MLLKNVTEVSVEFEELRAAMLSRPHPLLDGMAAAAGDEGDRLLFEVGLEVRGRDLSRRPRLEVGEVHRHRPDRLAAAWLGPDRTHLALTARYEPPFGVIGRAVDRALLHRVAEAVAQRFLEAVARRLAARPAVEDGGPGADCRPQGRS